MGLRNYMQAAKSFFVALHHGAPLEMTMHLFICATNTTKDVSIPQQSNQFKYHLSLLYTFMDITCIAETNNFIYDA